MRIATRSLLTLLLSLAACTASAQLLPEPRDGDIRVVYWDFRSETEVFLTLQLKSPNGETLPVSLTLNGVFPGKRPVAPLTQVEVRAQVGNLWAPLPRLTIVLDRVEAIEFAAGGPVGLYASDSEGAQALTGVLGTISIATLKKMTAARRVAGNVLRLEFELDSSQRAALARFAERVLSPDPSVVGSRR